EGLDRLAMGPPGDSPLQVADRPYADGRPLGQDLLGHSAGRAQLDQQIGEGHPISPRQGSEQALTIPCRDRPTSGRGRTALRTEHGARTERCATGTAELAGGGGERRAAVLAELPAAGLALAGRAAGDARVAVVHVLRPVHLLDLLI